ncbi:hypothetical protein FKG95_28405 [Denitrobaculum tricleocarpae]|uniref:Uncharacterized protein n=1 Tax=Denitrobaculum tricleocarpae TaxID=2591009 RepID=A0A545SYQ4_9PROT|nr:hypothetical protein FKG95_28405 [Denitrobaculum tricleocarpae]
MRQETTTARDVKQAAREAAAQVSGEVQKGAQRILSEVKGAGADFAEDRKNDATDYLDDVIGAAKQGTAELDKKGHARTAAFVNETLDRCGAATAHLKRTSPPDLWQEVNDFAQERPIALFGAAFLLGFGATRFLKSSQGGRAHRHSDKRSASLNADPDRRTSEQSASGGHSGSTGSEAAE